MLTAQNDKLGY